jgi:KaiC/GvpD/RAD55 family RecA-like ATPase/DNA-binding response OmpR family regulator
MDSTAPTHDRLISGIDLLDHGAGGLMTHKLYLVRGGSGTGKSLLGLQYLSRGLELHDPGVLITDQKPSNVLAQAQSIGFALDEPVKRGQLSILNPSGKYFDLVESPADVMAIIEELGRHIRKVGARRLVIDPIFALINTSYSNNFAQSITQSLLNAIEDLPVTTLAIASHGDDASAELNPILRQIEQTASGVIDLSSDAAANARSMRVSKLRYANNDELSANYRIVNGRGLVNYKDEWNDSAPTSRSVLVLGAGLETIRRIKETLGDSVTVQAEADLKAGVERAKRENPNLVLVTPSRALSAIGAILDLAQNATSSIAFLSPSANRQADKVLYLQAGADDFITEPFTPSEFRARVDALIRRSGRRLNLRGTHLGNIKPEEIASLMNADENIPRRKESVMQAKGDAIELDREFDDRLQRNVDTVSKFDQPFALYWMKATQEDRRINDDLAQLCRQEDIVCHNRNGEFVAILTGTDQNGVKGFEKRLNEKLGKRLDPKRMRRGYSLYNPGEPTEGFTARIGRN